MEVGKLFNDLESNNLQDVEETKKKLLENFSLVKDPWLVQGMMDYFCQTNSVRVVEILVKVQHPHDKFIFDRLHEWMRSTAHKIPALTLFGYIVLKHPTWLFKVESHPFMKELLKLLKNEYDIVPVMSALLCIITLLPIIPFLMKNLLQDLFEVFSHLASWKCQNPTKLSNDYLFHLQFGLYSLFQRLYGMYPCNFVNFLRQEFVNKEKTAIFTHTIKPLLETVKMHPMLVTSSRESETHGNRWHKMEPHDVVVECAKISLDYLAIPENQTSDCQLEYYTYMPKLEIPSAIQMSSYFYSITEQQHDLARFENVWTPSAVVLATPPPTGTVPHTPTPTPTVPNYPVPVPAAIGTSSSGGGGGNGSGGGGTSPPETAVEATPETTPMKDNIKTIRPSSSAVRAIWGVPGSGSANSQPSSPMKKESSPFRFPETSGGSNQYVTQTSMSQKLTRLVNDRSISQIQMSSQNKLAEMTSTLSLPASPLPSDESQLQTGDDTSKMSLKIDSPSVTSGSIQNECTQEDQEVLEINSQQQQVSNLSTPLIPEKNENIQDFETGECGDNESEGSPCSAGGLHIPNSRSILDFANRIKRWRMYSHCMGDTSQCYSAGTSPADNLASNFSIKGETSYLRRSKSWPDLRKKIRSIFATGTQETVQQNGDSSSPSAEEAISAVTHFRQQQKESLQKSIVPIRISKSEKTEKETQTIEQWPLSYEYIFTNLFLETTKTKQSLESHSSVSEIMKSPNAVLEKYIELSISKKKAADTKNWEDMYKDQIQLLTLQLQYERHRREVHSERNRRLLGRSRTNRALDQNNEILRDQVKRLSQEITNLSAQLNSARKSLNNQEQDLMQECINWKMKYKNEADENKQLRLRIETLQRRLNEETKSRCDTNTEIETARGELFDLRNDMRQALYLADMGHQYRDELTRLQSEMIVMGEIQLKCKEKLSELSNLKVRDGEIDQLQLAFDEEIHELRATLNQKSSQLDTAKARLSDLENVLSRRDGMFTEQKRLLKSVKEEYEEKFEALEKKYLAQKAIILRMEEHILELYKNPRAVNIATLSPESDKTDMVGSLDHTSPLSLSLASSEGLSASLRSVTEIKNLQALVVQPNSQIIATTASTTINNNISTTSNTINIVVTNSTIIGSNVLTSLPAQLTSSTSSLSTMTVTAQNSGNNRVATEDIPVPTPGPSSSQYQYHHYHHHQ